jgi:hypothetical protein
MWRRENWRDRCLAAVGELRLPSAVFKTCPWQPRELIETGLRQWLRCCAAALNDGQIIGMPSHAVDEAWHGFILCTALYQDFCAKAYGRFLHHHPDGVESAVAQPKASMDDQLRRTVVAWSLVARPGEECVLWNLDSRVGVEQPWGLDLGYVENVKAVIAEQRGSEGKTG